MLCEDCYGAPQRSAEYKCACGRLLCQEHGHLDKNDSDAYCLECFIKEGNNKRNNRELQEILDKAWLLLPNDKAIQRIAQLHRENPDTCTERFEKEFPDI